MPELPEVECLARAVREETQGFRFTGVNFLRPDLREPMPFDAIRSALVGANLRSVWRRSKYLLIETDRGTAILHLGMSGQLLSMDSPDPVKPHTHVIFELRGGGKPKYLHFVDPRRFGRLTAVPAGTDLSAHPWLSELGPEPLEITADALADHLWRKSRGRKAAVKPFIMDGAVVVGVGNIYASESLYLAGIRPGRAAGRVTRQEYRILAQAIQTVLGAAIEAGGTSFRDYLHSDGSEGSYALQLNVYGRSGEACRKCLSPVRETRHLNRATYFCGTCQK
jgi:formamidopyrimidine-DNA glycosylase